MPEKRLIELTQALASAGYEITSYIEKRDVYYILELDLKITPLRENKNNDNK